MTFVDEHFATNVVSYTPNGTEIRGLKNLREYNNANYDAFPDLHWTLEDIIVEGDKVAVRYTITGTHKGKFMGIPPTNKKITMWQIGIHHIVGDKLVESWTINDSLSAMQQLGVVPK